MKIQKPNSMFTHTVTITVDIYNPNWRDNLPAWISPAQRARLEHRVLRQKQIVRQREELKASHFVESDGGRENHNERRDCTVRAIATAVDLPYEEAHRACARFGRENQKGMRGFHRFMYQACRGEVYEFRGAQFANFESGARTVESFLRLNLKGRYIVSIKRHVFAVIDGKAYDTGLSKSRSRIDGVWKVFI